MKDVFIELRGDTLTGTLQISDSEDFPLSIDLAVSNLKNLTKRKGSFSKDFVIPQNENNLNVLNYINDLNFLDHKDVRNSTESILVVENEQVLHGRTKITTVIKDGIVSSISGVFTSNNSEWIELLDGVNINDFEYGDPINGNTHLYTEANQRASWTNHAGADWDYFYGLINYGKWRLGNGGVQIEDIYPSVYIRSMLQKAFNSIGYTINSAFNDSQDFKSLVYPFIGEGFNLSASEVNSRKYKAGKTADRNILLGSNFVLNISQNFWKMIHVETVQYNDTSTGDRFDNGSNYNTGSFFFEVASGKDGIYNFKANIEIARRGTAPVGQAFAVPAFYLNVDPGSFSITSSATLNTLRAARIFAGSLGGIAGFIPQTKQITGGGTNTDGRTTQWQIESGNLELSAGDKIYVGIEFVKSNIYTEFPNTGFTIKATSAITSAIASSSLKGNIADLDLATLDEPSPVIIRNNSINIKSLLREEPVLDVIKGANHVFNLYWTTDLVKKEVSFEPRDDFYKSTSEAIDWTDKLDLSRPYEATFLETFKREVALRYKEDDKDEFLNKFNDVTGRLDDPRGGIRQQMPERFPKGETVIENPFFAWTYHIVDSLIAKPEFSGFGLPQQTTNNAPAIARMWKDWVPDTAPPDKFFDYQPRILFSDYEQQTAANGNAAEWLYEGSTETTVPFAVANVLSEVDNDFSLAFQSNSALNKVGRFEANYAKTFAVIEDERQLTAFFNLTAKDIAQVKNLDTPIYIDGPHELKGYYIIDQINGWAPTKDTVTKVTLIKFRNLNPIAENDTMGNVDSEFPFDDFDVSGDFVPIGGGGNPTGGGGVSGDFNPTGSLSLSPSAVLNNGSTNTADLKSGSVVLGQGLQSVAPFQTVLGNWNNPTQGATLIIGGGVTDGERSNALTYSQNGLKIQGGPIVAEVNGNIVDVVAEVDGEIVKVYKTDG